MSLNNTDQQLKLKTGTTSQITTVVNDLGVQGEPLYATDTGELYIHNGTEYAKITKPVSFAQSYPRTSPVAVESMDSGWSDELSKGTVSHDGTDFMQGTASIKVITPTDGTFAGMSKTGTFNFSENNFSMWVKASDFSKISQIQLEFQTDASNYYNLRIGQYFAADFVASEWYEMSMTRGRFAAFGTPNWSNITKIVVKAQATGSDATTVWFDGLTVLRQAGKPAISISFDDGRITSYTKGIKYMEQKGLIGTMFTIPTLLGTTNYMNQAQIDDIARKGWDISGHGEFNLVDLGVSAAEADLANVADYLNSYGYPGSNIYAYPNGANTTAIREAVRKYFPVARTINYINQPLATVNPMRLNALSPMSSWTYANIKEYIDMAVSNNEWCILTFHNIADSPSVSTEIATATFQSVIDYIASLDIDVLPISRVLEQDWQAAPASASGDVTAATTFGTNNVALRSDGTGKGVKSTGVVIADGDDITGVRNFTTSSNIKIDGQAGAGNAFSILNRGATNRFGAFQFQTAGTTVATIGIYNDATDDIVFNSDASDAGRRRAIIIKKNAEVVVNEEGGDRDFRVEGDTDQNLIFSDASVDMVGIGVSTPEVKLDVNSDSIRIRTAKTPATATSTGIQGQVAWDSSYIYVCVATDVWKRTALSSW